ncbi:hypothetical protein, partial [Lysinibacillus xylanilyticus]
SSINPLNWVLLLLFFIHDPNALTDKDLFKLKNDLIEKYELKKYNPNEIELSNKINSTRKKIKRIKKITAWNQTRWKA